MRHVIYLLRRCSVTTLMLFVCKIAAAICLLSFTSPPFQRVNLIWQLEDLDTCPEKYYEADWIREILAGVQVNEIVDGKCEIFMDNSIIICGWAGDKIERYFAKLHEMKYNVGAIMLGDEAYAASTSFYHHCKFVLRNYWHKKFFVPVMGISRSPIPHKRKVMNGKRVLIDTKIKCFPLGYKEGFWKNYPSPDIKEASQRAYNWSFAGQITKSTRVAMVTNMKKIPNGFLYEVASFNGPDGLPVQNYRNMLLDTIFVPCPRGWWNLDSYRVTEALECGCIPIVEKYPFDYFEKLMDKYPFLAVNSWDEAPALIEKLLEDPAGLELLRLECYTWWLEYKKMLQRDIADLVKESFFLSAEFKELTLRK